LERVDHRSVVGVGGKNDDFDSRFACAWLTGGLDSVAARHPQIHEDDVGLQIYRQGDSLGAVYSGADDVNILQ
jgi:hypothetical protein